MTTGAFNDAGGDGNPLGQRLVVLKIRRVVEEIVGTVVHTLPRASAPPAPPPEPRPWAACPPRPDWPSRAESRIGALASSDLLRVPGRGKRHPPPSTHTAPHG